MGTSILYHNITQEKVNETDIINFVDEYNEGDIVYKSENGNACIEKITDDEMVNYIKYVEEWYDEQYSDDEQVCW